MNLYRLQNPSKRLSYTLGTIFGLLLVANYLLPSNAKQHAAGPMNTGHEALECEDCHTDARGSFRQQMQANVRYMLGVRKDPAPLVRKPVANEDCLACHQRPDDRHPVFRFMEPKFRDARIALSPQYCVSCHREHNGKRVTVSTSFCENCHVELVMRKDPLDIPHHELIEADNWSSCLGCHDFHGNYRMNLNTKLEEAVPHEVIQEYFDGAASPYGEVKKYSAKKERVHEE